MENPGRFASRMADQAQGTMVDLAEEAQATMTRQGSRRRKPIAVALVSLTVACLAGVAIAQVIRRRRRRRDDGSLEAELEQIRDGQRQLEEELNTRSRRSVNVSA